MAEFSLEQIQDHWQRQALLHGQSPAASWSDTPVIHMEIREILKHLQDGDRVLDIGCANGYSTLQFASQKTIDIVGVDYIPGMIEQARARLLDVRQKLKGNADFQVGDITSLDVASASYDKVVVIRVVINLGDWQNQLRGLLECSRVLKPGGTLLLSEATLQGWRSLNNFRNEWSLPEIPIPAFNTYLDEESVAASVDDQLQLLDIVNFASSYFVGTRVLKPLLARALGLDIDIANPDMNWNRWFSGLPAAGDYGTQKLFVFRKR